MKAVLSVAVGVLLLLAAASPALAQICGDANDDGACNIGDGVFLMNCFYKGGPMPPNYLYADADGYQVLTLNDIIVIITGQAPVCPPAQRKFSGPPNNGYQLFLDSDIWPAGVSTKTIEVRTNTITSFIYAVLPLLIHVGSESPDVLSITLDPEIMNWSDIGPSDFSAGPGRALLSIADTAYVPIGPFDEAGYPDGKTVATIELSLANAPTSDQTIRLGWDMDCPPVDPTYGSSNYPVLLVSWTRGYPLAYTPVLPGEKVPSLTFWGAVVLAISLLLIGIWLYSQNRRLSRVAG